MSKGILMEEQEAAVELQHINVKLFLMAESEPDLDQVVNAFHTWIQEQPFEELLLDVADYRHVHHGPGIVLIGHEADYSLDDTDGRLGLRYNRKATMAGSNADRLRQATQAALRASARLQEDPRLNGRCIVNAGDIHIVINDRALIGNSAETRAALDAEFRAVADSVLGEIGYELEYESDPRRLFGVRIKANQGLSVSDLRAGLDSREPSSHGIA